MVKDGEDSHLLPGAQKVTLLLKNWEVCGDLILTMEFCRGPLASVAMCTTHVRMFPLNFFCLATSFAAFVAFCSHLMHLLNVTPRGHPRHFITIQGNHDGSLSKKTKNVKPT